MRIFYENKSQLLYFFSLYLSTIYMITPIIIATDAVGFKRKTNKSNRVYMYGSVAFYIIMQIIINIICYLK